MRSFRQWLKIGNLDRLFNSFAPEIPNKKRRQNYQLSALRFLIEVDFLAGCFLGRRLRGRRMMVVVMVVMNNMTAMTRMLFHHARILTCCLCIGGCLRTRGCLFSHVVILNFSRNSDYGAQGEN